MKRILVAINWVKYKDPIKKRNQDVAVEVLMKGSPKNVKVVSMNLWDDDVETAPVGLPIFKSLQRNSQKKIGNTRRLPYIKDIFDLCYKIKGSYDSDIFGYINSDILLPPSFYEYLDVGGDTFYFYRTEIGEVSCKDFINGKVHYVPGGDKHAGNDAFFFRKKWWGKNRELFPDDLIVGESEWDTVFRHVILMHCQNYFNKRSLFHVYHNQKWDLTSPGALNNIRIWDGVKAKYWPPYLQEK